MLLAAALVLAGCSSSESSGPEQACAEPTAGVATGECKDSGVDGGPLEG